MKYFQNLIITGFLIPFLPMNAETPQLEESYTEAPTLKEEAPLSSLDEELSMLDEEFQEFKDELFSLEDTLQKKEITSPAIATSAPQEATAVIVEATAVTSEVLPPQVESAVVTEALPIQVEMQANKELVSELAGDLTMEVDELPLIEKIDMQISEEQTAIAQGEPAILSVQGSSFMGELEPINEQISINLAQAFAGSPIIYSLLLGMSVCAVFIWLYSLLSLNACARVSHSLLKNVRNKLNSNNFDEVLSLCEEHNNLFCKMISSGIHSRRHGLPVMIESMKAEGKRATISFWQKIGLLNDIAVIAPMIGLLGTVLGMFYAFYDVNRSIESISVLFDGLGISVGTTVAGLIVAILALILHSTAKYRLVRALALVENEAQNVATLIDDRTSIHKG